MGYLIIRYIISLIQRMHSNNCTTMFSKLYPPQIFIYLRLDYDFVYLPSLYYSKNMEAPKNVSS